MKKILFSLFILTTIQIFPQQTVDKIVAVVDNEIILKSELDFQVNLFASQRQADPNNPQLRNQVLNAMIEDKLILAQANLDSITVSEDEVTRQIDYQIDMFIQQYGSRERVEEIYGMSIEKIKRELRDDVRKNLMVQRLQEKNFAFVESSRREVEEFFIKYKDSLGVIPERVRISHIFSNPKTSQKVKDDARKFAQSLLDSIKNGADFAELAKRHSEDPGSAVQGGDLGFVRRGVFFPEFESAAYTLDIGQLSSVVESPVGFHIIQLLERRGETVHTRHILIKPKIDEEADLKTIEFLTDIRDSIVRYDKSFSELARKYSDDKETASLGGNLGNFYLNQLDKSLLDIVSKLKEGEISFPRRINYSADSYGYHIVYLVKRVPQHLPDLELDYSEIKKISDEYKKQRIYAEWIAKLKDKIFWEVRI